MFLALGCPGQVISGMSCLPSWLGYQLRLRWPSWSAPHSGVTVTYSVCIGGAGIDYSSVTSILYTYSAFHHPAVLHQWVRATLAQLLG